MDSRLDPARLLPAGLTILLALLLGCSAWFLLRDGQPSSLTRETGGGGAPAPPAANGARPAAGPPVLPAAPLEAVPPNGFGAIPAALQPELGGQGPHHLLRGRPRLPYLCLTFDGAAHADALPRILEILANRRIPATFFLTGEFIARHPGPARSIVQAGHEVGNHLLQWRLEGLARSGIISHSCRPAAQPGTSPGRSGGGVTDVPR
jgi:hypothetical protein